MNTIIIAITIMIIMTMILYMRIVTWTRTFTRGAQTRFARSLISAAAHPARAQHGQFSNFMFVFAA